MSTYGDGTYGSGTYGDPEEGETPPALWTSGLYREAGRGYRSHIPYRGPVTFPLLDYDRDKTSNVWLVDRNGDHKADLSLANIATVSWLLNDAGSASFSLPVDDPRNSLITLGKDEVMIELDGVLWWGRFERAASDHISTTYECRELLSYYDYRFVLTASLEYTSVDQVAIATAIHETAQTGELRDFNIDTGVFPLSGKVRSRIYERDEHPNILEILKEFTELKDGFDIGVEYDQTGLRQFMCYFPRKGTTRPSMVLEWGRNIQSFVYNEDAVELATQAYCTGGSSGEVRFEGSFKDVGAATYFGTNYETIISEGSQKDVEWLEDKAQKHVEAHRAPLELPSVTVMDLMDIDEPVQVFGVVEVGDIVPVRIKRGRVNVNGMHRVVGITRNATARTTELTLALPEVLG